MTRLCIYRDTDPRRPQTELTNFAEISTALGRHGIRFERWTLREAAGAAPHDVLEAYREDIARLQREHRYAAVDVVSMTPDHPDREAARQKFSREHRHAEDEVRCFADGMGLFYLHIGAEVLAVLCERGDLLSVPAGVSHWFDMGAAPRFVAVRFFDNPAGWVPQFTGSDVARQFPSLDDLAGSRSSVVLLDIEGTLSPISFVKQVLFPYARLHLPAFLRENRREPRVRAALENIRALTHIDIDDAAAVIEQLSAWQDADAKVTPLKQLQGFVWEQGYRRGQLRAPLYPDARQRLLAWHLAGVPLVVYSSGSAHAQRLFFQYSSAGDIRRWFAGHEDTSIGSKHDERSYRAIARRLGRPPASFLFLSDSLAELDAALAAGMRTCWVDRGEDSEPARSCPVHRRPTPHLRATTLLDVAL